MKIRTLIRVTKDYQVSEVDMEQELPEDIDLNKAATTITDNQNICIAHATSGLQKALGQTTQIKKQPPKPVVEAKKNMKDLL